MNNHIPHQDIVIKSYSSFFTGIHSSILDKTIYPGGRRFLDINHPLRQDTTFPSGATEDEVVIKRSAEDEKAEARYLDRLLQEKIQQG